MRVLISKIGEVDSFAARVLAFIAALILYGTFGSPTPDYPGVIEALIAVGLVVSVGIGEFYRALRLDMSRAMWEGAGRLLLIYGLSVPVIMGALGGHDPSVMLRDVLPFLFMFLPVFLYGLLRDRPRAIAYVLGAILIVGFCFAIRASLDHLDASLSFLGILPEAGELTYLANSPTVLFAALFLLGAGARRFVTQAGIKNAGVAMGMIALGALILLPMILSAQRASLGYVTLYVCILVGLGLWRSPYRSLFLIALVAACLAPIYGVIGGAAHMVIDKTSLVGFNMRFEEIAAVWGVVSDGPLNLIFGQGWGAGFESPAVGGVHVNYTHSLFSSALLKMGLLGLALVAFYMFSMAMILARGLFRYPLLTLALAGPFAINALLYASFKSLDFGLILLLIIVLQISHQNSGQEPR